MGLLKRSTMSFALYLTGAPASGKSTAAALAGDKLKARVLSYGELLSERLHARVGSQAELREHSSKVIAPDDVFEVDQYVREQVRRLRQRHQNVIVDSHALTAERYGFRAVPYSAEVFGHIGYTHVACLEVSPEITRARIEKRAQGRPLLSEQGFAAHAQLQAALALAYAHSGGIPFALIDSSGTSETTVSTLAEFVGVEVGKVE